MVGFTMYNAVPTPTHSTESVSEDEGHNNQAAEFNDETGSIAISCNLQQIEHFREKSCAAEDEQRHVISSAKM